MARPARLTRPAIYVETPARDAQDPAIMIDFIKNTFLAGIGATVVTKEMVEEQLNDFVKKGKMSADEAREAAERITDQGKSEFNRSTKQLTDFFEEMLNRGHIVSRSQYEALEQRVAALEQRLNQPETSGTEPGA